jgi:zinc protease
LISVVVFLASFGVGVEPGPAVPLQAAGTETALYEISGLKVIHRINDASDVVAVQLYLLGGTRQLTEENTGIELLLLRTAELESGRAMARTGSRSVLAATADWTVTGFTGLRDDLDVSWSVFARRLERPGFSSASLERARGELVTGSRRRYTQPDLRVEAIARRVAFQGHPYSLDHRGMVRSLTSLSPADLERYWEEQFVTSRMLLVVVGDITRANVDSLVRPTVAQMPTGQYEWTLPPPVQRRDSSWWAIDHKELPTNYIVGYFGGPSPTDGDYFAFRAAVALLSAGIDVQVREQQSLSYRAYAPFLDRAAPVGGVYTSSSSPAKTFRLIRHVMENIQAYEPPLLSPWWNRFLDQFTLEHLMQQMTSEGQAEALARAHLYFDDLKMADGFVRRLKRVRLASACRTARRYMIDIQFAYLGDTVLMRGAW